MEAEELKSKIQEAKNFFTNEKKELFKQKQTKEFENVSNEHKSEVREFELKWKKVFSEFETRSNLAVEKLEKKNADEIKTLSDTVDKDATNIKFSSYCEKIIEMEMKLVEKEKFIDAQKIRDRVMKVKENEIQKYLKDQVIKYNTQVGKLNKLHDVELKNLKKKIEEERLNLERERIKESQEIEFKFKSRKIETEVKQRHDKKVFDNEIKNDNEAMEKNLTTSGVLSTSTYNLNNNNSNSNQNTINAMSNSFNKKENTNNNKSNNGNLNVGGYYNEANSHLNANTLNKVNDKNDKKEKDKEDKKNKK